MNLSFHERSRATFGYLVLVALTGMSAAARGAALPTNFISASTVLFQQGLADPRGGEYRHIDVRAGSVWGGSSVVQTRGWVLPQRRGDRTRTAVCWNGLGYDVLSVGGKADLRRDFEELLARDRQFIVAALAAHDAGERDRELQSRARNEPYHPFPPHVRWASAMPEAFALSHTNFTPIKAVLLWRAGESALAARTWEQWFADRPEDAGKDPYLQLATDWVWALFDSTVCAHMRGDDKLVLAGARALGPIQAVVDAEATLRSFKNFPSGGIHEAGTPYFPFLKPVPRLLADQERRAKASHPLPASAATLKRIPQQGERTAALIAALEEIAVAQMGQPGAVPLSWSPIVAALVDEGEPAVEPLIDCVESDQRLTRSVGFHRDFFPNRSLISVAEAAYEAVCEILKTRNFGGATRHGLADDASAESRRAVVAELRDYWRNFKGVSRAERWFSVLTNDQATRAQWVEAADQIVRSEDLFQRPLRYIPPRLDGDPLRARQNPSVTELMARRAAELRSLKTYSSNDEFALHDSCIIAMDLARWDPTNALPTLRAQMQRCRERMGAGTRETSWTVQRLGSFISELTDARARAGDADALREYTDWLRTVSARTLGSYMAASFRALWRHADAPGVAAAAGWLFNDPDSPWAPLLKKTDRVSLWHLDALITSPLVGVPAFRKQLLAELANTNRVGTLRWKQGGQYDISLDAGGGGTTGVNHTNTPAPGTEIVLRHRDYIAHRLASLSAMPAFEYFWPEARRDEAAADCAAVLRQFGGRFRYRPRPEDPWTPSHFDETARMTFDALDHPATRDDVRTGRAIFSLEGEGTIRVCPLAPAPLAARWVALTNYPYDQQFLDSRTGKAGTRLAYVQEGEIWQAEELWRTDHWERLYGFAGAHHVARVPAADIEFPPPSGLWYPLSRKVDCMAAVAESSPRRAFAWPPRFVLGDPLWIELRLHNRAGLEQTLPAELLNHTNGNRSLYRGVTLHLFHTPDLAPARSWNDARIDATAWTEIKPLPASRSARPAAQRTLAPGEECAAGALDLNGWFKLTVAGRYRFVVRFNREKGAFADGESNEVTFTLSARQ